jgi:hypothetical protein
MAEEEVDGYSFDGFLPRKTLSMVAGKRGDDLRDLVDLEDRGWRVITNLDPQR